MDRAVSSHRCANGQLDRAAIEYRERARIAEANGTDVCVGRRAECGGAGTEDLRRRRQMRMNLEADDCFPRHGLGLSVTRRTYCD